MDRFKFRIWDIKQQKYRQRTHHEADTCINCLSGKVLFGEGIEIYGEEDDKDVVIEQCTGLKDKNGKLIYENDVVDLDDSETYAVIQWGEEDGCWRIITCENSIYTFDNLYGYELTICGNIHENADLLGENE